MGALAATQVATGRLHEALQTCQRALEVDKTCGQAYALQISILQRLGRFREAIDACETLRALEPANYRPCVEIVRSKRISSEDAELVDDLERMVSDSTRDTSDQFHLHRALGKAYDDLGRFELAIGHFEAANKIARESITIASDPADRERELKRLKAAFPQDVFRRAEATALEGPTPILIVGMIRSGTTLLDSMLSRLPDVRSAGEVRFWSAEAARNLNNPQLLKSPQLLSDLQRRYLETLAALAPVSGFVIDKMPLNYAQLGFVRRAVPQSKIVHLRRNPADTAISIYTSDFGPEPPPFAFDKARIVHAYRLYQALMEHWRSVLPKNSFIEIDYERLVLEPEPVMREVLEFIGLPWSDDVLSRANREVDVNTPSRWQARQPLYNSSIDRWKSYAPWLGELSELV
jgi:tetratricopeptide (TPR) repeat protein